NTLDPMEFPFLTGVESYFRTDFVPKCNGALRHSTEKHRQQQQQQQQQQTTMSKESHHTSVLQKASSIKEKIKAWEALTRFPGAHRRGLTKDGTRRPASKSGDCDRAAGSGERKPE